MRKPWKIASVIAAVLVAGLAGLFYWTTWEGSTKEIESVANLFQPKPEWRQTANQVVPPRTICLEANCPSVHRVWETNELVTKQELKILLARAGWEFGIQGDCLPSPNVSGGEGVCYVDGTNEDYKIGVEVVGDYGEDVSPKVTLLIEKKK